MLRPNEANIFKDINGVTAAKTDPVTLVFTTINNLNLNSYGPKDKFIRDPNTINIWLQYPNDIIRDLARKIVDSMDSDDIKMHLVVDKDMSVNDSHEFCHALTAIFEKKYGLLKPTKIKVLRLWVPQLNIFFGLY